MAKLQISMTLTTNDGLVKKIDTDFDFGDTDDGNEMAIDQYWANLKGSAAGSEIEERGKREKMRGHGKLKK